MGCSATEEVEYLVMTLDAKLEWKEGVKKGRH